MIPGKNEKHTWIVEKLTFMSLKYTVISMTLASVLIFILPELLTFEWLNNVLKSVIACVIVYFGYNKLLGRYEERKDAIRILRLMIKILVPIFALRLTIGYSVKNI